MGGHDEKRSTKFSHHKKPKPIPPKKHRIKLGELKKHNTKHARGGKQITKKIDECLSTGAVMNESTSSERHHQKSSSSDHKHQKSSSSEHHHQNRSSSDHKHHKSSSSEHQNPKSSSSEPKQHKSSSSEHQNHKCNCCKRRRRKNRCKNDCLCKQLRKFKDGEITITTKTGKIIKGKVQRVQGCCVKILEPGSTSPFIPKRITIIRCKDIGSFSVDCV